MRNVLCSKIGFGEECEAKIVSCNCEDERECCVEDKVFDVMGLRKLVKIERRRANMGLMELEQERMAPASSAVEAMAMIMRLQNEKSSIEIEYNQHRRLAEQKQEYDTEVIHSLQWIVMKHESERSLLEDKLRLCIEKLKQYVKDDETEQLEEFDMSFYMFNSTVENSIHDDDDGFIS